MNHRGRMEPVHISGVLGRVLQQAEAAAASAPREAEKPGRVVPQGRGRTPLTENGFTPIPRALDDLALRLARRPDGRTLARTLMAVLMDLARYTDNEHGDVIVTNNGIVARRGVSLSSVKATIKLLLELHVLQKTEPSGERLFQLQQVPGGFRRNRRYLVWNPQAKWRLSDSEEGIATVIALWNDYSCKANAAEMRDQGKGSPRSPVSAGEEVFAESSF
jgi:hypothetical protein